MKLAIVTGGSRGLGAALCEQLSSSGFTVLEFSRAAPHDFSTSLDLSDPIASRTGLDTTLASISPESVSQLLVIHNAGTLDPIGPVARKDAVDLVANLNTNLVSPIAILAGIVSKFQDNSCRKVVACVSSGASLRPFSGWSLYCAAKAGMDHFIRTLAMEQRSQANPFLAVNIDPGVIDTQMQAFIRRTPASEFPDVERFIQRKENGQLAPPTKVAASLLEILSRPDLVGGERYATN